MHRVHKCKDAAHCCQCSMVCLSVGCNCEPYKMQNLSRSFFKIWTGWPKESDPPWVAVLFGGHVLASTVFWHSCSNICDNSQRYL